MNWRINKVILFSLIVGLLSSSCEDFFEFKTRDMLLEEDAFKDRATIYAGMTGLASVFRSVSEEHIIAAELMGDLMEPTGMAPDEYWDLYRYKYDELNTGAAGIASPARYYRLIVNANDYLHHLIEYNKNYPEAIPVNVYRGLVSSALGYRVWAYLQIGKLYGEAYYYDLTYVSGEDTQPGKLLNFEQLLQELIYNMKIGVDKVNCFQILDWRTIVNPEKEASGFDKTWNRISIDPEMMLTELYLWSGDYINAAKTGINYVARDGNAFKLADDKGANIFFRNANTNQITDEAMTLIPHNFNWRQTHTLQKYFSNVSPALYYFKPSFQAQRKFGRQVSQVVVDEETNEYIIVRRNDKRLDVNYDYNLGEPVITKYQWTRSNNQDDSHIYIYRASEMYLMIAEALNGLGNNSAGDSILNVGLKTSWNGENQFFEVPFESPIYSKHLRNNRGVKGRAQMAPNYVRYYLDSTRLVTDEDFRERKKIVLDSLLMEETALELAYEGKRWFAMVRLARNSGRPELLADAISQKFGAEQEIYKRWLMKPENWFIRWDQAEVANNSETTLP